VDDHINKFLAGFGAWCIGARGLNVCIFDI
jgi:hypothetical protein